MEASTSSLLRIPLPRRRGPTERRAGARPRRVHVAAGGFADEGHLGYYAAPVRCGGKEKEEKKRAKLADSLSRDLTALMDMGFGVEEEEMNREKMSLSEAAEVLLAQLEKVRAKEREMKKKRKKEKECMKKVDCDDSSSSSSDSSDSSDSECEDVIDMRSLHAALLTATTPVRSTTDSPLAKDEKPQMVGNMLEVPIEVHSSPTQENECSSSTIVMNTVVEARLPLAPSTISASAVSAERIEVCMGGKCKKSGALQLMEEFERHVGAEGVVVGCKCMGKCKEGPNIRILSCCKEEEASDGKPRNPLCIGVGLADVSAIVSNYFGERSLGIQPCGARGV